jgi:hypothetical protein
MAIVARNRGDIEQHPFDGEALMEREHQITRPTDLGE